MSYVVGDRVVYTGEDAFYSQSDLMGKIGVVTKAHPSYVAVDFPNTILGRKGVYLTNVRKVEA